MSCETYLNGAEVDEEVSGAVLRSDEAVALLVVEPLDRSLGHEPEPAFLSWGSPPPSTAAAIYQSGRLVTSKAPARWHTGADHRPLGSTP